MFSRSLRFSSITGYLSVNSMSFSKRALLKNQINLSDQVIKLKELNKYLFLYESKAIYNMYLAITDMFVDEEELLFSLETINGNEYITKLSKHKKVLEDEHNEKSFLYSLQTLSSIRNLGFNKWKRFAIKINFPVAYYNFYNLGRDRLFYSLISTEFDDKRLIKRLSAKLNDEQNTFQERDKIISELYRDKLRKEKKLYGNKSALLKFIC